jgi:hypothetical protein
MPSAVDEKRNHAVEDFSTTRERPSMRAVKGSAIAILFLGAVAWPMDAWSISGTGWTQMAEGQRGAYIVGVVDGWFSVKDGLPAAYREVTQCLERQQLSYERMIATVEAYMHDHSSEWPKEMGSLTLVALHAACRQ